METDAGPATADVRATVEAVLDAVGRGDLARPTLAALLRLLEAAGRAQGASEPLEAQGVRLRTAPELSFPASDLRRCRREDSGWQLEVNHLGLHGVDGCLPQYFLEHAAREEGPRPLCDFLDLLGEGVYRLHYEAWKRLRPVATLDDPANPLPQWLAALAGESEGRDLHGGVASGNAAVLEDLLCEALDGVPVRVEEFHSSWLPVAPAALGERTTRLGDSAVLGRRVHDIQAAVAIRVGPVDLEWAMDRLRSETARQALLRRVRRFSGATLDFDLCLSVRPPAQGLRLGSADLRLGWSSFLGRPATALHELRVNHDSLRGDAGTTGQHNRQGERNEGRIDTRAA
ncbi:MAG: type VI secretion system baseplate subunit TssG [Gammaproteobacteria bacterium]|nr:MAG: type VI secretion system baseplate subunit TssG [Gammaproteobacteria bacterium]